MIFSSYLCRKYHFSYEEKIDLIMDKVRFDKDLAVRFVSDFSLPISVIDAESFGYFLDLFEGTHSARSLWLRLWEEVDSKFGGLASAFLEDYYRVRELVIQTVSRSDAYERFNSMDMSVFSFPKVGVSSNSVYNGENIGCAFVSIDMSKANFQALRYVDKEIVLGAGSWDEFIRKFTDSDYIAESKYFRQVVFGQMNPKRHITVEKYIMWKVYGLVKDEILKDGEEIVSFCNDELVCRLPCAPSPVGMLRWDGVAGMVKERFGIDVKVDIFTLDAYRLKVKGSGKPMDLFYGLYHSKRDEFGGVDCWRTYKSIPSTFAAITYKLLAGKEVEELDTHFYYEHVNCKFTDEFELEAVTKDMLKK